MEIVKNRHSGKYFIVLPEMLTEDDKDDKVLLINPESKIKLLNSSLFEKPLEDSENAIVSRGLFNELQVKKYREYIKERFP